MTCSSSLPNVLSYMDLTKANHLMAINPGQATIPPFSLSQV